MNERDLSDGNRDLTARRGRGAARRSRLLGDGDGAPAGGSSAALARLLRNAGDEFVWGTVWDKPLLDEKLRIAVALALSAARSQRDAVDRYARAALRAGWTRQELAEMLLHVACYAGFLAAEAVLQPLSAVFDDVDRTPHDWPASAHAPVTVADPDELPLESETVEWTDRRATDPLALRGIQVRREILGVANVDAWMRRTVDDDFIMMFFDATHAYCFGTLWARPGLERRVRSVLSLSINASQNQDGAVARHVRSCVHAGFSKRAIGEIFLLVYAYTGVYSCLGGFSVAEKVFAEMEGEGFDIPLGPDAA